MVSKGTVGRFPVESIPKSSLQINSLMVKLIQLASPLSPCVLTVIFNIRSSYPLSVNRIGLLNMNVWLPSPPPKLLSGAPPTITLVLSFSTIILLNSNSCLWLPPLLSNATEKPFKFLVTLGSLKYNPFSASPKKVRICTLLVPYVSWLSSPGRP